MPRDDAGNDRSRSWNGGRDAPPPEIPKKVPAQWWMDQGVAGGGREREDAPDDDGGAGEAELARAAPRDHRPGRLLQRLLRLLPYLPQGRSPVRRIPGGGGRHLLHSASPRDRGREGRERAGSGDRD